MNIKFTPVILVFYFTLSFNSYSQTGSSCSAPIVVNPVSTNSYSNSSSNAVWYQYTATKTSRTEITTCGFAYPLYLTVFASCNASDSIEIFRQNCPASSVDRDRAFFYATANKTYYFRWKNPNGSTNINFTWNMTEIMPSTGEICSTALPLVIGTNTTGGSFVRWFSYVTAGNAAEKIVVSACGTETFYSQIRFSCGENDFERSAKHNMCGASTTTQFEALPGTTYYLKVYPSNNSSFNVAKSVPVTGEVCSNPFTAILGTNHADHSNNTDQWYVYTPAQSGQVSFTNLPFGGDYEMHWGSSCTVTNIAIQASDVSSISVTANQPLYILLREKVTTTYDWQLNFITTSANLALNKPISASSVEVATLPATLANDGSLSTRWSSQYSDPQWLMVDLQNTYTINKVILNWETAAGKAYQIQVSPDGTTWTSIYTTATGAGGTETLNISGTGRYIRMYGTARTTTYGYSLYEFQVYGTSSATVPVTGVSVTPSSATITTGSTVQLNAVVTPSNATNKNVTWTSNSTSIATVNTSGVVSGVSAGTATITATTQDGAKTASAVITVSNTSANIALNKPVTASSIEASSYAASNINDNNTSSRWSSQFSDPQWVIIDLQANYSISKTVIIWETASALKYTLETSTDNANWNLIQSVTNGSGGTETWNFTATTGRYLRLTGLTRNTVYGYSIFELQVYGTLAGTNQSPVANPGNNTSITLPVNSLVLDGSASNDPDGSISAFMWTQVQGPNTATLSNASTSKVTVSNLVAGTYTFNLAVTDNLGLTASKNVNVTVNSSNTANIALNKPVLSSSIETGHPAALANDGNKSTRWSTLFSDPQWIKIDLQAVYTITQVVLNWETASANAYTIQVSNDDQTYSIIKTVTNSAGGIETWNFTGVTGRYIEMLGTIRNTVWGYSLYEFEVYGTSTSLKSENISPQPLQHSGETFVFPNPFSDHITLNRGDGSWFSTAKLYDVSGKLVESWIITSGEMEVTLELSSLKRGFYILKLEGTGETKVISLIKN